MGFFSNIGKFFTGSPAKRENVSTLRPEQEGLYQQLQNANMGRGAGGSFGTSADYYRDLLSDNPADMQAFAAPELRRFNEQTIPGLSEQFAGMGSGGLQSSGFRNAAVNAGTDLSERLGAMRANLRQQGAAGLAGLGQQGLQSYSQNIETQPGTEGMLAPALGAIGTAIGGPLLGAASGMAGDWLKNSFGGNKVGANSSPYGGNATKGAQMSGLMMGRR